MKRIVGLFCLFILFGVCSVRAEDKVWTADELPMVHLQDSRRYVCNPDGVLSQAAVDSMDAVLGQLERTKGIQSVIVVVKQVEDGDPYTFGMNLGRKYGVGSKKQQSGLIVVLSTEDRKYYILTGFGLEGALPDAICKRIENQIMVPLLKEGDWDSAMVNGVKAISGYLQGDRSLTAEEDDDGGVSAGSLLVLFFFILVFAITMLHNKAQKCPRCGSKSFVKTPEKYLYTREGWDYYQVVFYCKKCKYSESKVIRRKHEDNDSGGLLTGVLLGSMLGGRGGGFSGGGFSGGSFGGGGFGGGGAGGGF